jgi:hypothetical protein
VGAQEARSAVVKHDNSNLNCMCPECRLLDQAARRMPDPPERTTLRVEHAAVPEQPPSVIFAEDLTDRAAKQVGSLHGKYMPWWAWGEES